MLSEAQVRSALHGIVDSALKASFSGFVTGVVEAELGRLVGSVAGEVARAGIEGFAGPLLRILFRLSDQTGARLDKLIREPLTTGMREAVGALNTPCATDADRQERSRRLSYADGQLARAVSLCDAAKDAGRGLFYISFIRGLIASANGSAAFARNEFAVCLRIIGPEYEPLRKQREGLLQSVGQVDSDIADLRTRIERRIRKAQEAAAKAAKQPKPEAAKPLALGRSPAGAAGLDWAKGSPLRSLLETGKPGQASPKPLVPGSRSSLGAGLDLTKYPALKALLETGKQRSVSPLTPQGYLRTMAGLPPFGTSRPAPSSLLYGQKRPAPFPSRQPLALQIDSTVSLLQSRIDGKQAERRMLEAQVRAMEPRWSRMQALVDFLEMKRPGDAAALLTP